MIYICGEPGLPPGCWFYGTDAINFSLIGLCCSLGAFDCNYATFSLQPQPQFLLLAVQEFMNHCIYFVLQKLLHFYPFCLSCNCTSTPNFAEYLLSCALVLLYTTWTFFHSMLVCLLKKTPGLEWQTALTNRVENVFLWLVPYVSSFKGPVCT